MFMIIVNTPGDYASSFGYLHHASWHGFTPTDLVFPAFLFIIGISMSRVSKKWDTMNKSEILISGFRRAAILFLLGYLLYWFPFFDVGGSGWSLKPLSETRIFGVLQRIGLCYALALPLILYLSTRKIVFTSAGILLVYWWVLACFGDYSLQGNAALKLDLLLLGPAHLYHGEGMAFDPEGILSSLPSVVSLLAGFVVGKLHFTSGKESYETLAKILLAGCALVALGYLWDPTFPINKKIWTSSYVLLTTGLCMIIMAMISFVVHHSGRNPRNFNMLSVVGKNPLFLYLLSSFLAATLGAIRIGEDSLYHLLYVNLFGWIGGGLGSLLFALSVTAVCYGVGHYLHKNNIFIRV